ncbi:hypothetical protein [Chamaesiphon polymorphus]|uniref:hypothetical protein n=1 Tax=Chamaesiphon polymorphus TaxID=2107691 RepID=UPI0015E787A5|nr:hypothetical protein [Chamaesiphon polymorphus]
MPKSRRLDAVTSIESIGLQGILAMSRSSNMNVKAAIYKCQFLDLPSASLLVVCRSVD